MRSSLYFSSPVFDRITANWLPPRWLWHMILIMSQISYHKSFVQSWLSWILLLTKLAGCISDAPLEWSLHREQTLAHVAEANDHERGPAVLLAFLLFRVTSRPHQSCARFQWWQKLTGLYLVGFSLSIKMWRSEARNTSRMKYERDTCGSEAPPTCCWKLLFGSSSQSEGWGVKMTCFRDHVRIPVVSSSRVHVFQSLWVISCLLWRMFSGVLC